MMSEKALFRWLREEGFDVKKGRRENGIEGYMIIDKKEKTCVAGEGYKLNIYGVEAWAWSNL